MIEIGITRMKIEREVKKRPARICLYGTPGIGKTTFAAACPRPLVFDLEDGASRIKVDRVPVTRWGQLIHNLTELASEPRDYQTVVIDTLDAAERMLRKEMTDQDGRESIESYGFGKGFTMLGERFEFLIERLKVLWEMGFNIVLLAQSGDRRKDDHEHGASYDEWDLKLTKKHVLPVVVEWVDALLFARYDLKVVERDGKKRSVAGDKRILKTTARAGFNAKNRYGLPDETPFSVDVVKEFFTLREPEQENVEPENDEINEDDLEVLWLQLPDHSEQRFERLKAHIGVKKEGGWDVFNAAQKAQAKQLIEKAISRNEV